MEENPGIYGLWCKACELSNAVIGLCDGLTTISENSSIISENNVEIKNKVVAITGDPNAECPACPIDPEVLPFSPQILAAQADSEAAVALTATMRAETADIQEKAKAVQDILNGTAKVEVKAPQGGAENA